MRKVNKSLQRLRADGVIVSVDENAKAFNFSYTKA
jgi:hypothetical protein